jgi:cytochrome c oxidase accessory protein FixG
MPKDQNLQSTIGEGGRRIWLYPSEVKGVYQTWREATAWAIFSIFFLLPWFSFRGDPLFQLDVASRKIILMGSYFWPQDLGLFLPFIIALVISVFAVTSLYGRIWCGWACPQALFPQFLYDPLERLLEGTSTVRKKRDSLGLSWDWFWRKALKHVLYLLLSFTISFTFFAYFTGKDYLLHLLFTPGSHPGMSLALVLGGLTLYGFFPWFKEQACILVCPYARFQTVLTDEKTLNIGYDENRGEPRGNPRKQPKTEFGDCINCRRCVRVCPTGIDIREGLQLECIGCAKCIDACNAVMRAWKREEGLVRYASLKQFEGKEHKILRTRVIAYLGLTFILLAAFTALLLFRPLTSVKIIRRGAEPYISASSDSVSNLYTIRIRNKHTQKRTYRLLVAEDQKYRHSLEGLELVANPGQLLALPLTINSNAKVFKNGRKNIELVLETSGEKVKVKTALAGPYEGGSTD